MILTSCTVCIIFGYNHLHILVQEINVSTTPTTIIYCEEEYGKLVLEVYWQARAKTKTGNNRYRISCIHCKESHKDKNTLSYHRMFNLCKGYTGDVYYVGCIL